MSQIAIVGMGCRFAGAPDLHAYWKLTLEGRDAFGPVPADRWDHDAFFSKSARATDKYTAPKGAFIEDIKSFPALFMGIPPRRVEVMDPQQRFAIETGMEAIADAGYTPAQMPHKTGVYIGVTANEYRMLLSSRVMVQLMAEGALGTAPQEVAPLADSVERVVPSRPFTAAGVLSNMVAAAVAQELDLHGPAYTCDAACASAMVAVNDAVRALRSGEVDAALAGGVYLCISPENYIAFSRIGAMSQQGQCLPFDQRADGFVQGDGAGVLVLKRLSDALRDGDRIYATIDGIATNNDGRGDGPMAPLLEGQRDVIQGAWKDAGTAIEELGYIETHGTGTSVGDVTEFRGLVASVGDRVQSAVLGSAKANVGHTMSAAAVAGLIRAALAIHHRVLPPMANFETAKDELELDTSPFQIPTQAAAWSVEARRACVSSFGFGGTNGHAVLGPSPKQPDSEDSQLELVCLSARDDDALRALAAHTAETIRREPRLTVAGIARAWSIRPQLDARLAIPAKTREELLEGLEAYASGRPRPGTAFGTAQGTPSVALLFPGQGAQRLGMLSHVAQRFPVVAASLARSEAALADLLDTPITHLLYPERRKTEIGLEEAAAELTYTANCQPVLFAVHQALYDLLDDLGVTPTVVTGHSLGEFNAAVAAGVLTHEHAALLTGRRGAAMAAVEGDPGAMAALRVDAETAASHLAEGAVVANVNHPDQTVISGTTAAVAASVEAATAAGVECTPLDVSHAFHSPLFDSVDGEALLTGLTIASPQVTVASCIADRPYANAEDARAVFGRHARSPVQFMGALRQCEEAGADLYLQVGAGGPLASFARRVVSDEARAVLTLAGREDDDEGRSLLTTLGWLWAHGVRLNLERLPGHARVASVPPSPLPRESYWAIKDDAQMRLKLTQRAGNRQPDSAVVEAPAAAEAPTPDSDSGDAVADAVVGVLAKVSSYPRNAVQPTMGLANDLGFDSLMVADLATGLADAFPGLGGLPQELMINSPTVQDIVEYVRGARHGGVDEDDNAPLSAWAPCWRPTALPASPPGIDLAAKPVLIVGRGPVADALAAEMVAVGAEVTQCTEAEAADAEVTRILVWTREGTTAPLAAVLSGEADLPDPAGEFIAALDRQATLGSAPDVVLVRGVDDPWSAGLAGAVRATKREWTDSICKTLTIDGLSPSETATRVTDELGSHDTTIDVRWTANGRDVLGMTPAARVELPGLGDGQRVLITGGTRGIGAKLAQRLCEQGCHALLVGRGTPNEDAAALIEAGKATLVQADVTDRDALVAATEAHQPVHALVHCAGVLADGALGEVAAETGALARAVKVAGWVNALVACGPTLQVAMGIGSWAGRFGNRHQAHYAAANAQLAALTDGGLRGVRMVVGEYGPWSDSEMVSTIPAAIRATMRSEGVDFVGDEAGLDALMADLQGGHGIAVRGRRVPHTTRARSASRTLSVQSDPFLADHAIGETPVLPLAAAADLMAEVAGLPHPFEVVNLKVFGGVQVTEPTEILTVVRGDQAEIRVGERRRLAYTATVRPASDIPEQAALAGGEALDLTVERFYDEVTFHGPLLAGILSMDGVGPDFCRGVVKAGSPVEWSPETHRTAFAIDPLALDSAFQLAAMVAWERYRRAGTPVSLGRFIQLAPTPEGPLTVDVSFGESDSDRFEASFVLRGPDGTTVAIAEQAAAELVEVDTDEPAPLVIKPEWVDPTTWDGVRDLNLRLEGAAAMGVRNPFFTVHLGTAKNTTETAEGELINFSSYNYLGLSGDERILRDVHQAVDQYGTSVSASRVASGERPFHGELEAELAAAQGCEDSLVFTAGHATNVTTIGHLFGPGDLILHDELIHDSALQGIKLSGAGRRGFRHDDPEHLESLLKEMRPHAEKVLIVVEGVYSMDGDICALPEYLRLKKAYGCMLMVDEAHSFGIVGARGCGAAEHYGLDAGEVDLWMGTLSKSLASCGGWIAGSKDLITYLRYTAPGFVYSAGITAANGVAALSALRLMLEEPWRVEKLQSNAQLFHAELDKRGLDTGPALGGSGVIPVITGNSFHALMLSQRLVDGGINVQPIVYPAVADDAARLRFFLSSTHTPEQLIHTAEMVAKLLSEVRTEFAI